MTPFMHDVGGRFRVNSAQGQTEEQAHRLGRCKEADLGHDADPYAFGRAMLKCEGYAPDCSHHGRCMHGGECFASRPNLVAARMVENLIPEGRAGLHLAYLRAVADMLRKDRVAL